MDLSRVTRYTIAPTAKGRPTVYVTCAGPRPIEPGAWTQWVVHTGRLVRTVHLETDGLDEALEKAHEIAKGTPEAGPLPSPRDEDLTLDGLTDADRALLATLSRPYFDLASRIALPSGHIADSEILRRLQRQLTTGEGQ